MKNFSTLTEREVLAVVISFEEEDSRIYMTFAEDLKDRYLDTATVFERMAAEERDDRHRLLEMYEARFGQHLPPIRREDVRGLMRRRPIWLVKNLSLDTIRKEVESMEQQPPSSTPERPGKRRTSAYGGCSAISPRRKRIMKATRGS